MRLSSFLSAFFVVSCLCLTGCGGSDEATTISTDELQAYSAANAAELAEQEAIEGAEEAAEAAEEAEEDEDE